MIVPQYKFLRPFKNKIEIESLIVQIEAIGQTCRDTLTRELHCITSYYIIFYLQIEPLIVPQYNPSAHSKKRYFVNVLSHRTRSQITPGTGARPGPQRSDATRPNARTGERAVRTQPPPVGAERGCGGSVTLHLFLLLKKQIHLPVTSTSSSSSCESSSSFTFSFPPFLSLSVSSSFFYIYV